MSHHWGYVSAITSAILSGISSILNKIALENVNPTLVAGMIYFIGGVLLLGIHFTPLSKKILSMLKTPGTEEKILKKDLRVPCDCVRLGDRTIATPERPEPDHSHKRIATSKCRVSISARAICRLPCPNPFTQVANEDAVFPIKS